MKRVDRDREKVANGAELKKIIYNKYSNIEWVSGNSGECKQGTIQQQYRVTEIQVVEWAGN